MYSPRLIKPKANNKFYNTKSKGGYSTCIKGAYPSGVCDDQCDVLPNCVGYALGRFNEIAGSWKYDIPGNAENFWANKGNLQGGTTPKVGAIIVWQKGATLTCSDGYGHVAIVEQVISPTQIVTSESGYGCSTPFWTKTRFKGDGNWGSTGYKFLGFIYNPAVSQENPTYQEKKVSFQIRVNTNKLNIRSGPSTVYNISSVAERNQIFDVKGEALGWYHVDKGWLSSDYVVRIEEKVETLSQSTTNQLVMGTASENKTVEGAKGDQTGKEVVICKWYDYDWDFMAFRPVKVEREAHALQAIDAAKNDNIGYAKADRNTLNDEAVKVNYQLKLIKKPCNCDSTSLQHVLAVASGAPVSYGNDGWKTSTMMNALKKAGYVIITDKKIVNNPDYSVRGAIYVKLAKHAACSITNGAKSKETLKLFKEETIQSTTSTVKNSPLVNYIKYTNHHSGKRTHKIDRITPHCVVGQCTVEALGYYYGTKELSSNYGIGYDGKIGLYVDEANRSWCSSSNENDQRAITIEVASDVTDPYAFKEAAYKSLVLLCADICNRYGKKKCLWISNKTEALIYEPKDDEMLITVHRWFANKSCPGDWFYNRLPTFVKQVNEVIAGTNTNITTSPVTTTTTTSYVVKITTNNLRVREQPSTSSKVVSYIKDKGYYTIVQESKGEGATMWGKLKSGLGWISLDYVEKVK